MIEINNFVETLGFESDDVGSDWGKDQRGRGRRHRWSSGAPYYSWQEVTLTAFHFGSECRLCRPTVSRLHVGKIWSDRRHALPIRGFIAALVSLNFLPNLRQLEVSHAIFMGGISTATSRRKIVNGERDRRC